MNKGVICIISSQILGSTKIGGFGSMTYQLARQLMKYEWVVKLLVPRRKSDPIQDQIEGIPIYYYSKSELFSKALYKSLKADIFHSQNQTIASTMARWYCPDAKHVVTCRDPRSKSDWLNEFKYATFKRKLKTPFSYIAEESILATWSVKKADVVACPAKFLIPKIKRMYRLKADPIFLPNIEEIPDSIPPKDEQPTVCWVGRFAKRKNPERYLKLAESFPDVSFLIAGKAEERARQQYLENWMNRLPNLTYLGFKNKFTDSTFYQMYDRSWILCNTSTREGLPLTFIEAAGRGCSILSYVNPDDFSSKFGFWAKTGNFEEGLEELIKNNAYQDFGKLAFEYVQDFYDLHSASKAHISLYSELLQKIESN